MTIVEDTSIDNFVQKIGISKFCFRWQKAHILVSEEKREANKQNCFLSINSMVDTSYHHHLILKFLKSGFCVKHIVVAIDAFLQENFCVAYWPIIYLTIVLHCLYHHVIVTLMAISMSSSLRSVMYMLATTSSSSSEPSTHPCQHHSLHVTCLAYFPPPKQAGTQSQHKTKFKTHRRRWRRCLHHDVRGATGCRMSVWIHSGGGGTTCALLRESSPQNWFDKYYKQILQIQSKYKYY